MWGVGILPIGLFGSRKHLYRREIYAYLTGRSSWLGAFPPHDLYRVAEKGDCASWSNNRGGEIGHHITQNAGNGARAFSGRGKLFPHGAVTCVYSGGGQAPFGQGTNATQGLLRPDAQESRKPHKKRPLVCRGSEGVGRIAWGWTPDEFDVRCQSAGKSQLNWFWLRTPCWSAGTFSPQISRFIVIILVSSPVESPTRAGLSVDIISSECVFGYVCSFAGFTGTGRYFASITVRLNAFKGVVAGWAPRTAVKPIP